VFEDLRQSITDSSRVVNAIGIGVPPSKIRNRSAAAMDEVVTMADVGGVNNVGDLETETESEGGRKRL
jgi:hypothetical protein